MLFKRKEGKIDFSGIVSKAVINYPVITLIETENQNNGYENQPESSSANSFQYNPEILRILQKFNVIDEIEIRNGSFNTGSLETNILDSISVNIAINDQNQFTFGFFNSLISCFCWTPVGLF